MTSKLDDSEFKEIATRLFNEEFVSIVPEEYIQFLTATDEESKIIRSYYMDLFKWDPNLLKSTRMLCSKLYLKGESQQIDRILTSFTQSYIKQNPVNIFCTKNFEKIYIVLYSLVLLNTSLHNEVTKKSKISQSDYIKNTFTTFMQQDAESSKKLSVKQRIIIEKELAKYYDDLSRNELQLKTNIISNNKIWNGNSSFSNDSAGDISVGSISTQATSVGKYPNATDNNELSRQISSSSIWSTDHRPSLAMKRVSTASSATTTNNNANRVGFTRALLTDQNQRFYHQNNSSTISNGTYGTVRNRQSMDRLRNGNEVHRKSSRASIISKESLATQQDDVSIVSFESVNLDHMNLEDSPQKDLENFNINEFQDQFDLTLELQGSPYLKEGILKLKILNNDQQDNNLPEAPTSSAMSTTSGTNANGGSRFFSFFRRGTTGSSEPTNSLNSTGPLNNKYVEYFVVVSKGELNLYSFDPKVIKKHQAKLKKLQKKQKGSGTLDFLNEDDEYDGFESVTSLAKDVGDGNWLNNAANVGNYNLCSTFAQIEKSSNLHSKKSSGHSFTNSFNFSLTFPKVSKKPAKKFLFEAGTREIALEFINTCNFWASKITAIPTFEESVSSIEYGWNNLDNLIAQKPNFKKLKTIQKWDIPATGVYLSSYNYSNVNENHYNMMKQFIKTLHYYNNLKRQFKEFNELRLKFFKNFGNMSGTSNYTKILQNFELKVNQYKFDLKKYKNYLILLGFGLQLRFDMEDDENNNDKTPILHGSVDELENDGEGTLSPSKGFNISDEGLGSIESPKADTLKAEEGEKGDSKENLEDGETELSRMVKYEIRKLFIGLKDVGKIIPTFQSSKSISNLNELQHQIPNLTISDINTSFNLVKSPKYFTLSNYNEEENGGSQILPTTQKDILHSFSTNTIKEEEEEDVGLDMQLQAEADSFFNNFDKKEITNDVKDPKVQV